MLEKCRMKCKLKLQGIMNLRNHMCITDLKEAIAEEFQA